ncbi:serine/threonine-protein kinase [Microbispora hainanensis]|uniref:serine/threonine-protein kinase n=1 Tax=Microbispora hainanensis TaxID=568844 RepID=UPI001ABF4398|nr:serine/threonine-protein kinase [Microbispora hainanensis]
MGEAGGPLVPGYEVLGILGQGGFGVVYRARQLAVGREVALKVDNRVLVSDRDRRRFMREVTSAGALSGHPHVADVYDAGVLPDGRPYMVLELCPNGSLADRLRDAGPLGPREVRDIGIKIADALAAAHAVGVLHRDVKPANILVNSYGMVALSDFGLATMPGQGGAAGGEVSVTRESLTPAYAPPEAFDLTEPTAAGDVYALSATLYALLQGRPPRFPDSGVVNIAAIIALHRLPVPDIPGAPAALTAVLRHGMETEPARRIPTAAALRDALAALAPDGSASGNHPHPAASRDHPRPAASGSPAGGPGWSAPSPSGPASAPGPHPGERRPGETSAPSAPGHSLTGPAGGVPAIGQDLRRATTAPNAAPGLPTGGHRPSEQRPFDQRPPGHSPVGHGSIGHSSPGQRPPEHPPLEQRPPGHRPAGPRQGSAPPPPPRTMSRQSIVFAVIAAVFALLLTAGIAALTLGDGDREARTPSFPGYTSGLGADHTGPDGTRALF